MHTPIRLRVLLILAACSFAVTSVAAGNTPKVTGVEPTQEQLPPVDPAWKAAYSAIPEIKDLLS